MQMNFHSLLWSYLPRVLIFLAMTVCTVHSSTENSIDWDLRIDIDS